MTRGIWDMAHSRSSSSALVSISCGAGATGDRRRQWAPGPPSASRFSLLLQGRFSPDSCSRRLSITWTREARGKPWLIYFSWWSWPQRRSTWASLYLGRRRPERTKNAQFSPSAHPATTPTGGPPAACHGGKRTSSDVRDAPAAEVILMQAPATKAVGRSDETQSTRVSIDDESILQYRRHLHCQTKVMGDCCPRLTYRLPGGSPCGRS